MFLFSTMILAAVVLYALFIVLPSIQVIGPTEVGLVMKRFGKKLPGDNPIAFHGEAGYQAGLLMPGVRFKLWLRYRIRKFPWVQVPANEIGVVIAQIGKTLPPGAKSARLLSPFLATRMNCITIIRTSKRSSMPAGRWDCNTMYSGTGLTTSTHFS